MEVRCCINRSSFISAMAIVCAGLFIIGAHSREGRDQGTLGRIGRVPFESANSTQTPALPHLSSVQTQRIATADPIAAIRSPALTPFTASLYGKGSD